MKITNSQDRINELLDADPRSLTAIADELGVSKQAVSSWKTGIRSPKKKILIKMAEMYNTSIEWLMGFDVDKHDSRKMPDTDIYSKLILGMTPEDYYTVMKIFEKTEIAMREKGEL